MKLNFNQSKNKLLLGYFKFLHYSNEGENLLRALKSTFNFRKDWKFLDIGSGDGRLTLPLSNKVKITTIIEPSFLMTTILKERFKKNTKIKIIKKRIEHFETNEKFDFILISHALYFIKNWESLFKKLIYWLKENGYLVIIIHAKSGQYYNFLTRFQPKIKKNIHHENYAQAESLLIKIGYKPMKKIVKYSIVVPNVNELIKMFHFFFGASFNTLKLNIQNELLNFLEKYKSNDKIIFSANDCVVWIKK